MNILEKLNEKQREAVVCTDGPLIVLAGAGSGKTRMLTARVAHLIREKKAAPHEILAVTFTNKAAAEMRERVSHWLNEMGYTGFGRPEVGTFHSVCLKILRRDGEPVGVKPSCVVYDDSDQLNIIRKCLGLLNIDEKAVFPKAVQGAINRAKCDGLGPEDIEITTTGTLARNLRAIYTLYQKQLLENGGLDFGEILCATMRLLDRFPEVREKYQKLFRYVHVDEYQDTNRVQYEILARLAAARLGGHGNLCVVGDEDQSIYKWRGADIRNILGFEKDFPGAVTVKLEQNYRSSGRIVAAATAVIARNTQRKSKKLWTQNSPGEKIRWQRLPDETQEAVFAVSEMRKKANENGMSLGEFAFFYRTNAQSRSLEDELMRHRVPYQVVGGLRFYDRREIKDILAYFRAILNPQDSISLGRIINVPARGIGRTTIEKLENSGISSLWGTLESLASGQSDYGLNGGTRRKLVSFTQLLKEWRQPGRSISEIYHLILDQTGYVSLLKAEGTEEALSRVENLEEFDNVLKEFEEKNSDASLASFLEHSALASDQDLLNEGKDRVKLMTLHASKGLEFDHVFIMGLEDGLFPSVRPWEGNSEMEIEEERRLFYVGMTRARKTLTLLGVSVRRIWGQVVYQEPSRFLSEIPEEYLESAGAVSRSMYSQQYSLQSYAAKTPSYRNSSMVPKSKNARQYLNHPTYGKGSVVEKEGEGENAKITVDFTDLGRKKFVLKYVKDYLSY